MAERVNVRKLLTEKFPPQTEREKVLGSLLIYLDERLTKTELAFTKVVTDLRELLTGGGAIEKTEAPAEVIEGAPAQKQHDATPFPAGVSASAGGGAAPVGGPPPAAPAGAPNKTGPMDEDLTPNAGGGPAVNPRPNNPAPRAV